MVERGVEGGGDGGADADVAEETQVAARVGRVPVLHGGEGVFEGAADGGDGVGAVQGAFDEGAAHVACGSEDEPDFGFGGFAGGGGVGGGGEAEV